MKRRFFIASSLSAGFLAFSGIAAWHLVPRNNEDLSVETMLKELQRIDLNTMTFDSPWTVGHKLAHMAQSIEYSISGYPVHKSEIFKSTVGKAAFNAFSSKGYMKHNVEENIPGAPSVKDVSAEVGLTRLIASLEEFNGHNGELAEHFAYGPLTKEEYGLAHVLHIKDHFSLLT